MGMYHGLVSPLKALLFVSSFLASWPAAVSAAQTLTITHATVIDTATGRLHPDSTVVVRNRRVVSVGQTEATAPRTVKSADQVIDAHGEYLMPGLWDMHTHVYFGRTEGDGTDLILPLFLANGVTGIRDMGSALAPVLHARSEIAAHRMLGPRMVVAGPMLDGPKSQYKAAIAISTAEDGRRAVDMLHGRGVDFIKVQSGVPREAYFAIAAEAKKDGIEFEGHVPDAIRASEAVEAGQRSFEHLIGIFEASSPDETTYLTGKKTPGLFLASYDPAREQKIVDLLAQHGIWQCPTLFWERGQWLVDAIDYTHDPDLPYAAHSWVTTQWPASRVAILKSLDTDPLAVREKFVAHELVLVRRLHAAGVPFLAGTDAPAGVDLIPGVSLHLELQRLVAAGFTPLEALQTATLNPARFLRRPDEYGSIAPGRFADMVLLTKNPLVDIANTRTIDGVVADGRYLSGDDLARLRTRLKQIAAAH